jgi:hypothetical protein
MTPSLSQQSPSHHGAVDEMISNSVKLFYQPSEGNRAKSNYSAEKGI